MSRPPVPEGLGSVTSVWAAAGSGALRVIRRVGMPVAWVLALAICAGSAFAVRDVLFPSLGTESAPSMWESRGPTTSQSSLPRGAMTALDGPQPIRSTATTLAVTSLDVPDVTGGDPTDGVRIASHAASPQHVSGAGSAPSSATLPGEDRGGAAGSVPATTSPGDHSTGTSAPQSVPVATGPAAGVTTTSTPHTGGTLPGGSGRGGSGSGGGGDVHDSIP